MRFLALTGVKIVKLGFSWALKAVCGSSSLQKQPVWGLEFRQECAWMRRILPEFKYLIP